ncbi:WD40 repeat-like protein [Coprinopsis marcescibilis]|uniref:WD40 repeat-like protein n=1 Tax=Coprinopsis marcescibilis TaxID=230819 RepID=A0A5C3KX10_COPMA|nr:WD40 repeat-like protein [Coprinopsis marcescibilis]
MSDNVPQFLKGHRRFQTADYVKISSDSTPKIAEKSDETLACECHKSGGRNLIVCIDGTANQFGDMNTNVIELYNLILKGAKFNQKTWYNSGIGSYARPHWRSINYYAQIIYHKIDLAIAWDFERTVQGAYRWLSDNYEEGDCIFLFGFSRGAFQVRVLSAMIQKIGLIYKGNELQIPFAYELYADPKTDLVDTTQIGRIGQNVSKAERFKRAFSHPDVKVHFVGAWETVSSIGMASGKHSLPGTTEGMTHVCYFRHALALDERRVKFLPEYAWGGSHSAPTQAVEMKNVSPTTNIKTEVPPHTLEVWFAGTHSDIGGGNKQNVGLDRSRPPLRWMVSEAQAVGLRTSEFKRELSSDEQMDLQESLKGYWHLFELLPFRRLTFSRRLQEQGGKAVTYKPHLWGSRKIHSGQKIHSSFVLADRRSDYIPKARPPRDGQYGSDNDPDADKRFWEELRRDGLANTHGWLEIDLFEYARTVMARFVAGADVLTLLSQISEFENGPQAVYAAVFEIIKDENRIQYFERPMSESCKFKLVAHTMKLIPEHALLDIERVPLPEAQTFLVDFLHKGREDHKWVAQRFLRHYTDLCVLELKGHTRSVQSVSISRDGFRIVSGSRDKTIRIWDAIKGSSIGEAIKGHRAEINSVAFSADGRRVFSASNDGTIAMWDSRTGEEAALPLRGHTYWVQTIAVSADGTKIVSGSSDRTIRIWDAFTGEPVTPPLKAHTDGVLSVAISLDGTHIISGGADEVIYVWDAATGEPVLPPLKGHSSWVQAVAISSDGTKVASGSADGTVRRWNLGTGEQIGQPLRGHSDGIRSVAFSPDGSRIVSASWDRTIRIWDVETGKEAGAPLKGHTNSVLSVAISMDGRRIISGSMDGTIRVWDGELAFGRH